MFLVSYIDDFYNKHICIAADLLELKFIQARFTSVSYECI